LPTPPGRRPSLAEPLRSGARSEWRNRRGSTTSPASVLLSPGSLPSSLAVTGLLAGTMSARTAGARGTPAGLPGRGPRAFSRGSPPPPPPPPPPTLSPLLTPAALTLVGGVGALVA
jgi:hypothetical protein